MICLKTENKTVDLPFPTYPYLLGHEPPTSHTDNTYHALHSCTLYFCSSLCVGKHDCIGI
ncbi:hypothetical protein BGW36DRAFT_379608, partial [Talaromyces proteolyticus]